MAPRSKLLGPLTYKPLLQAKPRGRVGSHKIGRHLYCLRVQYRWTGAKWVVIRRYWRLYRRNFHNHHLHGRYQWRWGRYRRISVHRYRLRILYRNYQGHWRKVRSYWHLWCRNH